MYKSEVFYTEQSAYRRYNLLRDEGKKPILTEDFDYDNNCTVFVIDWEEL